MAEKVKKSRSTKIKWEQTENKKTFQTERMHGLLPIQAAILTHDPQLVRLLLEHGGDACSQTLKLSCGNRHNAFDLAKKLNGTDILKTMVDYFCEKGQNPLLETKSGKTPLLTYLISQNLHELASKHILSGVDVNMKDESQKYGWKDDLSQAVKSRRAIHAAVKTGNKAMVEFLLAHGADPAARIRMSLFEKFNAEKIAQYENSPEILQILRQFSKQYTSPAIKQSNVEKNSPKPGREKSL